MRTVEYSSTYARSTAKLFKSVEHIKGRKDKIIEDFNKVLKLLKSDADIPDKYKPHKLKGTDLWDIHLLSKTSDVILLYRKYNDPDLGPMLFIKAITNHKGLDELTAMLVDCYDLTEEDLLIDP